MTREEAIRRLRYIRMDYLGYPPFLEPIDMAIEALSADAVQGNMNITKHTNDVIKPKDDVIEVVRCKDCRHSRVYQTDSKGTMQTYCVAFVMSRTVTNDDFCSWGERREP